MKCIIQIPIAQVGSLNCLFCPTLLNPVSSHTLISDKVVPVNVFNNLSTIVVVDFVLIDRK